MVKVEGKRLLASALSAPRAGLSLVTTLFSHRYWWVTLLVLAGMVVLARLGFWQLDRLEQRQARNAQVLQQLALPPLSLVDEPLPNDLTSLKYRQASADGEFDFSHQVSLTYQNRNGAPGSHLITPLVINGGTQAVLVDRGWIPAEQAAPENWSSFDEPAKAAVTGFVQLSQTLSAATETRSAAQVVPAEPKAEWYRVDIEAIQAQMPYELLPIFIQQSPSEGEGSDLPYRVEPEFDLSEGRHLGYAIQWYLFALILGGIYVRYVSKKESLGKSEGTD